MWCFSDDLIGLDTHISKPYQLFILIIDHFISLNNVEILNDQQVLADTPGLHLYFIPIGEVSRF